MLFSEHADVSVRPAIETDSDEMARIQIAAWRQSLAAELGEDTIAALNAEAISEQWRQAITTPPGAQFGVFTALSASTIVGFCAVSPEFIVALEVDPLYQREGHGSRLLTAAVDKLKRDGAARVSAWVPEANSAKAAFLESAGFGSAARMRLLQVTPDKQLREERWTAELS